MGLERCEGSVEFQPPVESWKNSSQLGRRFVIAGAMAL
jgi:hypothetical protein